MPNNKDFIRLKKKWQSAACIVSATPDSSKVHLIRLRTEMYTAERLTRQKTCLLRVGFYRVLGIWTKINTVAAVRKFITKSSCWICVHRTNRTAPGSCYGTQYSRVNPRKKKLLPETIHKIARRQKLHGHLQSRFIHASSPASIPRRAWFQSTSALGCGPLAAAAAGPRRGAGHIMKQTFIGSGVVWTH